ncbi:MAG: hypothetical protein GXY87_04945 [Tissierellia bacterium]|nr:hypothetical protein [Tissierellia bacterium]
MRKLMAVLLVFVVVLASCAQIEQAYHETFAIDESVDVPEVVKEKIENILEDAARLEEIKAKLGDVKILNSPVYFTRDSVTLRVVDSENADYYDTYIYYSRYGEWQKSGPFKPGIPRENRREINLVDVDFGLAAAFYKEIDNRMDAGNPYSVNIGIYFDEGNIYRAQLIGEREDFDAVMSPEGEILSFERRD